MKNVEAVLSVKFNSAHTPEKLLSTCQEDLEIFAKVPGLVQKFYLSEEATGAISGIYFFETGKDRTAFWNSELAQSIPARYAMIPESLRVEEYTMAIVLNEL